MKQSAHNKPEVSVILVNYNQPGVTAECLESLRQVRSVSMEIFVVENGCRPEGLLDASHFPEVHVIHSEKNLGFAGGNNLAIREALGEYILLLNNDTEVTPDFLLPMLETMRTQEDAGIVSPKILFYHSDKRIQYAGTIAINPFTCRGRTIGYGEKDETQYDDVRKTDLAHGACMLIRRDVIGQIGALSEEYFLYYEEYDFCERAKRFGYTIFYNGQAKIFHKESTSVGKLSPLKAYFMAKNRVLFARRNFKGWEKVLSISYYFLLALPKNLLTESLSGRYKNSWATLKGALRNISS